MTDKDLILDSVRKEFGDDAIFTTANYVRQPVEVISSGSFILDHLILEIGGFPRGRTSEIAGADGTGKTTVCLHTAANAQQQGLLVAIVDAEQKLDLNYAANLGVNIDDLLISQPDHLKTALGIMDALCKHTSIGLIIYDSVPALGSKREYEEAHFDDVSADYGKRANMLNTFFRRNIYKIRENKIAFLCTNQLRDKIGRFVPSGVTRTPGGWGLKHYASVRMQIRKRSDIKEKEDKIGQSITAHTLKNNVARPFRTGVFDIYAGRGIDYIGDVVQTAEIAGILKKRGSWYVYADETIGQGKPKTIANLKADTELLDMLIKELKEWLSEL